MRAPWSRPLLVPACALFLAVPSACRRTSPDGSRQQKCPIVAQAHQAGTTEARAAADRAIIDGCSPTQRVLNYLALMRQARTSTDLAAVQFAMSRGVHLRDERLFAELLDIAESRAATTPARVLAFVALASVHDSLAAPHYEDFIGGLDANGLPRGRCSARQAHSTPFEVGPVPLAPDYRQRILELRRRVASDITQPDDVRSAAQCS